MRLAVAALLGLGLGHLLALFLDHAYSGHGLLTLPHRCNHCHAPLRPYDALPLISYLVAGGRCRCGRWLAVRLLALPLGAAGVYAIAAAIFEQRSAVILSGLFGLLFLALAATDLERRLIPNRFVYPGLALAAAVSWLWPEREAGAAFLGGGLALGVMVAVYILSRGGFGAGDMKMATLVGLVVGYPAVVLAGFVMALSAGAVATLLLLTGVVHRREYIPYGPFLALGGLMALFWGR